MNSEKKKLPIYHARQRGLLALTDAKLVPRALLMPEAASLTGGPVAAEFVFSPARFLAASMTENRLPPLIAILALIARSSSQATSTIPPKMLVFTACVRGIFVPPSVSVFTAIARGSC